MSMLKKIIRAVRRRSLNLVRTTVPVRRYLRPVNVISPEGVQAKYGSNGGDHKKIYKNHETILPVTRDLEGKISPYLVYDDIVSLSDQRSAFQYRYDYEVVAIPKGRLYSDNISNISFITESGEIVDRVSYQYSLNSRCSSYGNALFRQKYFSKPTQIKGVVASLLAGNAATKNIGHWLLDVVPRIHLYKRAGVFDEINYFVIPSYSKEYEKYTLDKLGVSEEKIIVAKEGVHLVADKLIGSSHPRGNRSLLVPEWIYQSIRKEFLREDVDHECADKRVYISREDSKLRRVINEKDVIEMLSSYGFTTVQLSKMDMESQIALFSRSEIVVSASGAGLSKMFFAPRGAALLEIFSEGYVNTVFYNIAYWGGLKYRALVCPSVQPASRMSEGLREDLVVDLGRLEETLVKLL